MGVRGIRKTKEQDMSSSQDDLQFTSVDSILAIARQKELYVGEQLDIEAVIGLIDDISVKYVPLDASICRGTLQNGWTMDNKYQ